MIKKIKRIILAVILAIAVYLCLTFSGFDLFNFSFLSNLFRARPIVIDKTANVVEEINRLAELTTAAYDEDYVIVRQRPRESSVLGIKITTNDELVLITKGKVRAGFDLLTLREQDVVIDSVSITMKLPKPEILDVISNPSDFETYEETGKWSHEEVTVFKNEARVAIEKNAIENGILERAEESGKQKLSSFLKALGFKKVFIEIDK